MIAHTAGTLFPCVGDRPELPGMSISAFHRAHPSAASTTTQSRQLGGGASSGSGGEVGDAEHDAGPEEHDGGEPGDHRDEPAALG